MSTELFNFYYIIITCISLVISFLLWGTTKKINKHQIKLNEQLKEPDIRLVDIEYLKNIIDDNKEDKEEEKSHCRYVTKGLENRLTNEKIPKKVFNENDVITKLILEELRKNTNSTYFTIIDNQYCLILNMIVDPNTIILEHYLNKVKLKNFGAPIQSLFINCFEIIENSQSRYLLGKEEFMLNKIIETNSTIDIILDEAATKATNTLCNFDSTDSYQNLPDRFKMLNSKIPEDLLKYEKLIFYLTAITLDNNRHYFSITVEINEQNQMIAKTKRLSEEKVCEKINNH